MNTSIVLSFSFALSLAISLPLCGQEKSVDKSTGEPVVDMSLGKSVTLGFEPLVQQGTYRITPVLVQENRTVPVWVDFSFAKFTSNDGGYHAQTQEELQTYHDLGMTFRFIEERYLRNQLQLPDGEGIIVVTADSSGDGFKNGFRNGDIVLQVNETPVDTQYDFVIAMATDRGQQRSAKIRRSGKPMDLVVVMSEAEVKTPTRFIIGVSVDEINDVTKAQLEIEGGAAVSSLTDDGPAKSVGVLVHDIITHINGKLINNIEDLKQIVENSDGKEVTLDLVRAAKKITINVTPKEVPVELSASINWTIPSYNYITNANTTVHFPSIDLQTGEAKTEPTVEQRLDEIIEKFQGLEEQIEALKGEVKK